MLLLWLFGGDNPRKRGRRFREVVMFYFWKVGNPFESIYLPIYQSIYLSTYLSTYVVKFYFPIYIYFNVFACITTHLHKRLNPTLKRLPKMSCRGSWPRCCATGCCTRGLNCQGGVVPDTPQNGGFRKWWYPQIIHFNRDFHYKPSILGYPYFWKHPKWCWRAMCFFFAKKMSFERFLSKNHLMKVVDPHFEFRPNGCRSKSTSFNGLSFF